jgi:Zn-dependent peptidase ImmA (M78 family)
VIVDKGYFISQRGPQASTGEDPMEIEASQFAASLLMLAKLLRERVANLGGGPLLDHDVSQLALEFEVSEQAMTIRLSTLGLL